MSYKMVLHTPLGKFCSQKDVVITTLNINEVVDKFRENINNLNTLSFQLDNGNFVIIGKKLLENCVTTFENQE